MLHLEFMQMLLHKIFYFIFTPKLWGHILLLNTLGCLIFSILTTQ